ncbi:MAG: GTP-binding protein, partial [Planctomycetota bacterium]
MTTSTHLLRNVAIIAHVDHGKTTLVDSLLAFCGTLRPNEAQPVCVLDSDPQERERGITIFSKNCAVNYAPTTGPNAGSTYRVNIIDTPGHADFGGEVERVLRMADGVLLLVDAFEGPMPQTRFVLSKALELGLRPLVVLNKVDRPEARCDDVIDEIFDLLIDLGADDEMLEFDVIYASGRDGWAATSLDGERTTIQPILDEIVERVPHPSDDPTAPLQMLITTLDYSEYVGRIAIGRVYAGTLTAGSSVAICRADDKVERVRVQKLHQFAGLGRMEVSEIHAGDLCAVEGIGESFDLGDTIADPERPVALPRVAVDEPTLHMLFRVNDSPFAGREGKFVTSRQLADRLQRETQANVALRVETGASPEEFQVSGRGLLHLSVLIENMRREGYELSVGRPDVIERVIDGTMCE